MKKAKEQNHEGEKQNAKKSFLGFLSVELTKDLLDGKTSSPFTILNFN